MNCQYRKNWHTTIMIRNAHHSNKEYIFPIFVRPKKDNRWRMILNLKELNKNIEYFHFKMETLKNTLALVKPNCFFLLARPERGIFFSTRKQIFRGIPEVLLGGAAFHVHSFSQWLSMLPKIIHKIVETSDGPFSYVQLCVNNLYWWHSADGRLRKRVCAKCKKLAGII